MSEQSAGRGVVIVADADRAEQNRGFGIAGHERTESFPKQEQRLRLTLIFGANEGPAELERRTNAVKEPWIIMKQRAGVQTLGAETSKNLVSAADAVSAYKFLAHLVPDEEVQVIRVELIEIGTFAGALADLSKGDFAQTTEFRQDVRQLVGAGEVDSKIPRLGHALFGVEVVDVVQ